MGHYPVIGDLEEIYFDKALDEGIIKARIWYISQIFKSVPAAVLYSVNWSFIMFENYLKTAYRNFAKYKMYTFINISGLAVGMASFFLLSLWVQHEISFDRFHKNANRIFRITTVMKKGDMETTGVLTPLPLGPALTEEYPEVNNYTRIRILPSGWTTKYKNKAYTNDSYCWADPGFFEMFSFKFLKGSPETAFSDWNSAVITKKTAEKYFGNDEPVGKVINVAGRFEFKIAGVINNIPDNSHLQFNILAPFKMYEKLGINLENWKARLTCNTYIQIELDADYRDLNGKVKNICSRHLPEIDAEIFLQPLKRIHLHSDFLWDRAILGEIKYVYIFSALSIFILLIACVNFINLATARSAGRAREVGMRKVMGAGKADLVKQFFGESVISSLVSLILAVIIVEMLLPSFNELSGKNLFIDYFGNPVYIPALIGTAILTGILSGIYPSLFLSSFQPVKVLKGILNIGRSSKYLRKGLVVFQFSLSIILIICATVIYNQLGYIKNKDLGFDKDQILIIGSISDHVRNYDAVKNELLEHPGVLSAARGFRPIYPEIGSSTEISWEGKEPGSNVLMQRYNVSFDYLNVYRMELASGRNFSNRISADTVNYILNEEAVKITGMNSPLGKRFSYKGREGVIIGVVKNFHHGSLHNKIRPVILQLGEAMAVNIRISPDNIRGSLSYIEKVFKKAVPGIPFDYEFLDETINNFYSAEVRVGTIFKYFTILAIFLACLGLFGLGSFTAEQRTKEIGIRKIHGASVSNIIILLTNEFTKWVLLANIFAWPAAYFFMNIWLDDFAYKSGMGLQVFLFAGTGALIIAAITVCAHSVKASRTNPVDALKYE